MGVSDTSAARATARSGRDGARGKGDGTPAVRGYVCEERASTLVMFDRSSVPAYWAARMAVAIIDMDDPLESTSTRSPRRRWNPPTSSPENGAALITSTLS